MRITWFGLPLLLMMACGGGSTKTDPTPQDPNAPRTVTGTLQPDYFQDLGSSTRATDLNAYSVAALVPNGTTGYTVYPGTGAADGTFIIPAVPPGGCFIQLSMVGSNYTSHLWTTLSHVNLGGYSQGRTDWVTAPMGTFLDIQPTVSPAQGTAGEMIVPSLGLWRNAYFSTSLNAWRFSLASGPLPEQGKDSGFFSSLTPLVSINSEGTQTIASTLSLPPGGLQGGAVTQLTALLQPQTPSFYQDFSLDAGAFESALATVLTTNTKLNLTCTLKAQPYGATTAPLSAATLLVYGTPATTGTVYKYGLPYANPYPATWGKVVTAKRSFLKTYTAPGTAATTSFGFSVSATHTLGAMPVQPLTPLVDPVQNLKINGLAASSGTNSVGNTPTFTWDAPPSGVPNYYTISLYQVAASAVPTSATATNLAYFRTTQNRLQIPSGLLTIGSGYFAIVTAFSVGQYDSSHPARLGFPLGTADNITEIFVP
jgi:hypothetical protein